MTHVVFMDQLKLVLVYNVYFHTHPIYILWLFITFYKLIVCLHAYGVLKHNMRVTCNIVELMALWLVAYGKSICMGHGTILDMLLSVFVSNPTTEHQESLREKSFNKHWTIFLPILISRFFISECMRRFSKMNMRTFPLMPEEEDGGSKTGRHLVGKNHLYFWINCEHKNPGNETVCICHCQH